MAKKTPDGLSPNERSFCALYVSNGRNGTRAYMEIYPNAKEPSARTKASLWLTKVHIQAEVDRLTTAALKKAQVSADQVLTELAILGFSDIGCLYWKPGETDSAGQATLPGAMKPIYEMPAEVRRQIKAIRYDKQGRPMIEMWSEKGALTSLAKHHKLLSDVSVNITLGFSERLRAAREKRLNGDA